MGKKHLLFLNYNTSPNISDAKTKLRKYWFSYDVNHSLKNQYKVSVVDFIATKEYFKEQSISYYFQKKVNNSKFNLHLKTHRLIKKISPDVIYLHSLNYMYQLLFLKPFLKTNTKIIVQHHAERPPKSKFKKSLLSISNALVDSYIFTHQDMANEWKSCGILKSNATIYEQAELSTHFKPNTLINKDPNLFIWVGRLNDNKDPITVINAFIEYNKTNPDSRLVMFYSENDLLNTIQQILKFNHITDQIKLMGKVDNKSLEQWYQKSTYFILGSYYEGGSAALIESMACGCIPIVTNIPSNRAITNNGELGILFEAGNQNDLTQKLLLSNTLNHNELSNFIIQYFKNKLSFKALADGIDSIINKIVK